VRLWTSRSGGNDHPPCDFVAAPPRGGETDAPPSGAEVVHLSLVKAVVEVRFVADATELARIMNSGLPEYIEGCVYLNKDTCIVKSVSVEQQSRDEDS